MYNQFEEKIRFLPFYYSYVDRYEKYGVFRKHRTSRCGLL